jgi:hypothetical protein
MGYHPDDAGAIIPGDYELLFAGRYSMNRIVISIVLTGFLSVVNAQDEGPARSIMFENQQTGQEHLTRIPDSQREERGNRCMELLRKVDELKGKPQRRAAAMARYQEECELR